MTYDYKEDFDAVLRRMNHEILRTAGSAIPAKLYRLPDGTWINPLTITSIIPKDADQIGAGEFFPPRVIVRYGDEFASTINCEHMREAMEICDRICFEVNAEIEKMVADYRSETSDKKA